MQITEIRAVTKTRFQVYLDGQFAFVLYKGELLRYQLRAGEELSEEVYRDIRQNVVLKRAKLKALHLLSDMGRTESQLCDKLKAGGYTEDVVDEAVAYVKSFGYINDLEYARSFVEGRKHKKSRKELFMLLSRKGLDASLIEEALDECCKEEDAREAIQDILRRKRFSPETATEKEKQKICASLARKGFHYEDIRQVIQISQWNA